MKNKISLLILVIFFTGSCMRDKEPSPSAGPIDDISIESVTINDSFWSPRIENNYRVSLVGMLDRIEKDGDSPNPKLIEAAGYILMKNDDPVLQERIDRGIDILIEEMMPGGEPREWKRLLNGEMYRAGHFMEAAVVYYTATGNRKIIDAAIRMADDIDAHFGEGKRLDISQHEEIKIGLLKLYAFTGDEKYMKLAKFFMDERGHSHNGRVLYGEYAQDHMPVIEQEEVVGHTVRATYLYTPLAELAAITGEPSYVTASDRLWEDAVGKKTYLTGHIGTYRDHEDFGEAYELPNVSCWNETCASIGSVFWNHQLFSLHRDAKYVDMMERILYNGVLSGVSLDGSQFFYQNPLRTFGDFDRQPWFGPNCCPPNVARLLASLEKYIYAKGDNNIYVNLFIGSSLETNIDDNQVIITQETNYPWEGKVNIMVDPESQAEFTLLVRIPGWAGNEPMPGGLYSFLDSNNNPVNLRLNGKKLNINTEKGYMAITRNWRKGDLVEIELPMEGRMVVASEKVLDNAGMVALERGPLVYCVEGVDNNDAIMNLFIPGNSVFITETSEDLPGGMVILKGMVKAVSRDQDRMGTITEEREMIAVPYFAWANREPGEMSVWMARDESRVIIPPTPSIASASTITSSCGTGSLSDNYPGGAVPDIATRFYPRSQSGSAGFKALYDQVVPVNSFDGSSLYLSLRPQEGNHAWVQYDFNEPEEISSTEIYWKEDKQYCLAPESWQLFYRSGDKWIPVKNTAEYGVEKDKFNRLSFEPVTTDAVRLEIKLNGLDFRKGELGPPDGNYMPDDMTWYETGIIEWQVYN